MRDHFFRIHFVFISLPSVEVFQCIVSTIYHLLQLLFEIRLMLLAGLWKGRIVHICCTDLIYIYRPIYKWIQKKQGYVRYVSVVGEKKGKWSPPSWRFICNVLQEQQPQAKETVPLTLLWLWKLLWRGSHFQSQDFCYSLRIFILLAEMCVSKILWKASWSVPPGERIATVLVYVNWITKKNKKKRQTMYYLNK